MAVSVRQDIFNIPNSLTMLRIVVIPVVMWLMALGDPVSLCVAASLFSFAAITDFFDGYLARKMGLVSLTGKFLDPLADKLIVMATLVMLVASGDIAAWIVVIVLARELSVTGLRAIAAGEGIVMGARGAARYKTAFQLLGLVGMIIHYEYTIDFWIYEGPVNFQKVGFVLVAISVVLGIWSGGEYVSSFFRGVDAQAKERSDPR